MQVYKMATPVLVRLLTTRKLIDNARRIRGTSRRSVHESHQLMERCRVLLERISGEKTKAHHWLILLPR
jgi:hypothetical protein